MNENLVIYRIELYDPVNEENDVTVVVAFGLHEAVEHALKLFNESMEGPPLTTENLIDARQLVTEQLFFTKRARRHLLEVYGGIEDDEDAVDDAA